MCQSIDRPNDNDGATTGTASSVATTSSDAEVNVADVKDLDLDPELGILDEEAEAWVGTVDKKTSKKLKDKEVKRQEHIYEFIITEKHHCLTLKVMQKVLLFGKQTSSHLRLIIKLYFLLDFC